MNMQHKEEAYRAEGQLRAQVISIHIRPIEDT